MGYVKLMILFKNLHCLFFVSLFTTLQLTGCSDAVVNQEQESSHFSLPPFQFYDISLQSDGKVKAQWQAVDANGKQVVYMLCQTDPDQSGDCIYLGSVINSTEISLEINPLPLISSDMYVMASTGEYQSHSNILGVNFDSAQLTSMIREIELSNASDEQYLGWSVSLSADGETLAISAPGERSDGSSAADTSLTLAGAVYIYKRQNNQWQNVDYVKAPLPVSNDWFGYRVALNANGSVLAISTNDSLSRNRKGSVYVYRYENSNGAWQRTQNVVTIEPNSAASDTENAFGESIAISGDGNTLAVGDPANHSNKTGDKDVVYIFRYHQSNDEWIEEDFFQSNDNLNIGGGTGINDDTSDGYGQSVSLSWDGNVLAVGAIYEDSATTEVAGGRVGSMSNSGAVYVYRYSNGSWDNINETYIKASNTASNEFFGHAVSLSGNGNTLAVSALFEGSDAVGINSSDQHSRSSLLRGSGAVYLYEYDGNDWMFTDHIKAKVPEALDQFGMSVSLSYAGDILAVGAMGEDSDAIGINGNSNLNTSAKADSGAAYLFKNNGREWSQVAYLKAPITLDDSRFGYSLSLSDDGSTIAIGAPYKDNTHTNSGAVFIY